MNTRRRIAATLAALALATGLTAATADTATAAPATVTAKAKPTKWKTCDRGTIAVTPTTTTCGFAETVAWATYLYGPEFHGKVYSSTTRTWYVTKCHQAVCKTGREMRVTVVAPW